METPNSPPLIASPIEFWPTFVSPSMEEDFRRERLAGDLAMARFLAFMYVLTTVVLVVIPWIFKGDDPIPIIPRSFTILTTAALVLRLRYSLTPAILDRWLLGWFSVNLVMELWANSAQSGPEPVLAGIFFVWSLASLVPMRFSLQAGTASITTVGFVALILSKTPDPATLALFSFKLVLALAVGLICSMLLHRARRNSFSAHMEERETRVLLETALARIQTLEGILAMCSECKRIRRTDKSWVGLDVFVSQNTSARFSHGMCPECFTELYPEYSGATQDS